MLQYAVTHRFRSDTRTMREEFLEGFLFRTPRIPRPWDSVVRGDAVQDSLLGGTDCLLQRR